MSNPLEPPTGETRPTTPVSSTVTSAKEPGVTPFVVSLVCGLPVAGLLLASALRNLLSADLPGIGTTILGASATTGSVLAVRGLRTRPRTFPWLALILTGVPALLIGALIAVIVAIIVLFVTANR